MPVPQRRSTVLRRGAVGLLVGGVILVMVLVEVRPDHPGDGRCAELWNAPANQANRSVVRGRSFPLATVRGVPPNKAGQPGCSVLLREREDGPWLWFGAAITETSVVWDGGVSGVRYGTDARPAASTTLPTRRSSRMGALCFGDLGLLYGCGGGSNSTSSRCRVANPVGYSPGMSVEVQAVHQVTDELVDAAGRLLSQLSKSAAPLDAEGLARIASHQATTLFVARSQDVIVGMLTLVTFPLPSGLRARIEDVVVDQDARGQGVGTALTMAAIDQAQVQGARSIDLTSRASRVAANRLYQQLGFQLRDSNVYRYQPQPRPH
jgi:ribosomal protein S18 acetylase RimI-like enzyme